MAFACLRTPTVGGTRVFRLYGRKLKMVSHMHSSSTRPCATEEGIVEVGGVRLHYERNGVGPHGLLCIPGALGTARTDFSPQLEYFGRVGSGYTIVSYDPRGHGASRPPNRHYQVIPEHFLKTDANDAGGLMKALGFSKFSILGWSDGGVSAIILAAHFPTNVHKLVVWGSNAYVSKEDLELFEKFRDVSNWSARMREPLEAMYGSDLQGLWANWADAAQTVYDTVPDASLCVGELSQVKCPTLVVHGLKDPLCPLFHAEYISEHISGSRLHIFSDGKHNVHLRFAEEFNSIVDKFLKD